MSPDSELYRSKRARRGRLGLAIAKPLRALLIAVTVFLALAGVALAVVGIAAGYAVTGFAAIPLCVYLWWKNELRIIPTGRGSALADRLEGVLIARLPERLTPKVLSQAAMRCASGQFFTVRYGIAPNFLDSLLGDDPSVVPRVWEEASHYADTLSEKTVTAGMVMVALVKTNPGLTALLPHLNLSLEDLEAGLRWNAHIGTMIAGLNAPKRTGGIARDWSFGYIPLLERFGRNVSESVAGSLATVKLEAHEAALDSLTSTFASGGRQNVALVGPAGVGKNTIVEAFARRLLDPRANVPHSLRYRQVFMLDPSALLSAAPGRGELEGLLTRIFNEAYHAKNIILWLDNAERFLQDGIGSVDVGTILEPILQAGSLRMVLTMDEQKWLQIAARNPGLSTSLNRISVAPATADETMLVMQDALVFIEHRYKVAYMYQALGEAYRLSERYIQDLAQPARSIKLLGDAAQHAVNGFVVVKSIEAAIEQSTGVKVGPARGAEERATLLNLEDRIHERMINQTHAVNVVCDALRRARSGVRNSNRPVGTFLFLGPTGVGKTELAKALASVYFGGEENLIRLDLNEFSRAEDVGRLIQAGSTNAGSLTAGITRQPFSVVLLDEIEKAHPSVLATLLQPLDEGIMRDETNREVSFRDAIIIATSNAGADEIRAHIERGESLEAFEDTIVNGLVDSNQFRPEFLNRFDEIVTFRPLTADELIRVVDLILVGVNKNLALQKLAVSVDDDAKRLIVQRGYDPRLGARPMRRMVQRTVENILAKRMLSGQAQAGQTLVVTLADIEQSLASS